MSGKEEIKLKLEFLYEKLHELDPESTEDIECIAYIKEEISTWRKQLLKAEVSKYFNQLNNPLTKEASSNEE